MTGVNHDAKDKPVEPTQIQRCPVEVLRAARENPLRLSKFDPVCAHAEIPVYARIYVTTQSQFEVSSREKTTVPALKKLNPD